ncbi:MAG: aminomethyl-transferring glycine dehydrogenase, partial [Thermoanaerobaculia bacterium]
MGPSEGEVRQMLEVVGAGSLAQLVRETIPESILRETPLDLAGLPAGRDLGEQELLGALRGIAGKNKVFRSFLGMGYHGCITPGVIQRNILENPGWYTQYTPYQSEISQGRLEALLNFQTLVADLTGLPVANASLLDEGTAAAEAMNLCHGATHGKRDVFFVAEDCHPQTIEVVKTRAEAIGVEVRVGDPAAIDFAAGDLFGVLLQYPATDGRVVDYAPVAGQAHAAGALVVVAADLLALTLLRAPGEFGADIAVGSAQRFGVPMGYGGPHAAFLATREEYKRQLPGRIIGVSRDRRGKTALRMAMQTREQHIRREKATSNICTAQVLLAVMASMYAVYHGPEGLKAIARRVHALAAALAEGLRHLGYAVGREPFFDTLRVGTGERSADEILAAAEARGINLRKLGERAVGIALDETATAADVEDLLGVFGEDRAAGLAAERLAEGADLDFPAPHARPSDVLTHPVFNAFHTEHEMLRYIKRLESRDLSLATSMIPLGSCTMKLNATAEMEAMSWPGFASIHPFAPDSQTEGWRELIGELEADLAEITGYDQVSIQPNAGSQGELAGLLAIRGYHLSRGDEQRTICLIPQSAHGTNAASAVLAGMKVVVVATAPDGTIDHADLTAKIETHKDQLSAIMITYPSTHGVYDADV